MYVPTSMIWTRHVPKIIFPHLSSTRSLMNVWVAKPFLSWMVFWDTIKYKSNPKTSTKWHSSVHAVHLRIVRCLLVSKCCSHLSVGHVFFLPWPQAYSWGLFRWFSISISQENGSSHTPPTYLWASLLLLDSLESKQVKLLRNIRTIVRFHSVNNMDHGRSPQGWENNLVSPPTHNPSNSESTGQGEFSKTLYL